MFHTAMNTFYLDFVNIDPKQFQLIWRQLLEFQCLWQRLYWDGHVNKTVKKERLLLGEVGTGVLGRRDVYVMRNFEDDIKRCVAVHS